MALLVAGILVGCGGSAGSGGSTAGGPSQTEQAAECPPDEPGWQHINTLGGDTDGKHIELGGGHATGVCELLLVGGQGPVLGMEPTSPVVEGTLPPIPPATPTIDYAGVLLLSTDGGNSARITHTFRNASSLRSITFTDQVNGWIRTDIDRLFRSTDGGATWAEAPGFPLNQPSLAVAGDRLVLSGEASGPFENTCGPPAILSSNDGGASWDRIHTVETEGCFTYHDIDVRADTIAAVGTARGAGLVSISSDGGRSFEDTFFPVDELYDIFEVAVTDEAIVMAGTSGFPTGEDVRVCKLRRRPQGSNEWQPILVPEGSPCFTQLIFTSASRGYAVAHALDGSGTGIAVTNDGGMTWQTETLPGSPRYINQIFAASDGAIYALTRQDVYRRQP